MRSIGFSARRSIVSRSKLARAIVEAVEPRRLLAWVSGDVFSDVNGNGRKDSTESNLVGQLVFADYNYDGRIDAGEANAETNEFGRYAIDVAVRPFALRLSGPGQTYPAASAPHFYAVQGNGTLYGTGTDFGRLPSNTPPQPLGQYLEPHAFIDLENDIYRDYFDPGVAGQTIFADYNYDGVLDANEPSGVTDQGGGTRFYVAVRPFALRLLTANNVTQFWPANATPHYFVPIEGGVLGTGADFSVAVPRTRISGNLYDDLNVNGRRDPGEGAVRDVSLYTSGYSLFVDLNEDGIPQPDEPRTYVSHYDETGAYSFEPLPVGRDYTIIVLNAFEAAGTKYVTEPGGFYARRTVTAGSSSPIPAVNFGFAPGVSVSAYAFSDFDGDGQADPNEPGGPAVVWLDLEEDGVRDANEPITNFNEYPQGQTNNALNVPVGRTFTFAYAPDAYRVGARAVMTRKMAFSAVGYANVSFALASAPVAGMVFNDANGNGARDPGESGAFGQTVFADYDYDGVIDTDEPRTTSDTAGQYMLATPRRSFALRVSLTGLVSQTSPINGRPHFYQLFDSELVGTGTDFGVR